MYFVFGLLHYDGVDLTDETLEARKGKLRTILAGVEPPLILGAHLRGDGQALFEKASALGPGQSEVPKAPGVRDRRVHASQGKPRRRRSTSPRGARGRDVGKVGTGFSQASLRDLAKRLKPLHVGEPTVEGAPRMRDAQWAKPELVCEVRFTEWTDGGALRHPAFEGLREDKKARTVIREEETPVDAVREAPPLLTRWARRSSRIRSGSSTRQPASRRATWRGTSKRWRRIFLPLAAKRPLMLLRCNAAWPASDASFGSQGRKPVKGSPCFVQKHAGLSLTNIGKDATRKEEVIYVTKREELYRLVQLNAFELRG